MRRPPRLRGRRPSASRAAWITAVLWGFGGAVPASGEPDTFPEAQVKAELVERFTRFIEWPPESLGNREQRFVLGLVGHNDVERQLELLAGARGMKDRRVEVRRLSGAQEVERCHLVWISASARDLLPEVLARTSGKPVLTLGDTPGFAHAGVLINLRRRPGRIVFEINEVEVRRSGLKFSAQLFRLGHIIEPRAPP